MSLMRKFQKSMAAAASAPAGEVVSPGARVLGTMPQGMMGGQQLASMLDASLAEDLKALHDVASMERKAEIKRDTLLPKYRDYIAKLMASGKRHDLIGYYVVWAFDAGAIEEALRLAFWCLENGQALPEKFKSPMELFVATQTLAWAEAEYNAGRSYDPYLSAVLGAMDGSLNGAAWDVPDKIKAGYFRLVGLQAEQAGKLDVAVQSLERALDLGAQVKTALAAVKKRLDKTKTQPPLSAPETPPADTSGGESGAENQGG